MASIVVVGSGAAGLVCAWRLQRAGHDVEVLEREPEIGGRIRTDVHGSMRVPHGASFWLDGQRNTLGLIAALGLEGATVRPAPGESVPGAVLHRGRLERCRFGPASGRAKARGLIAFSATTRVSQRGPGLLPLSARLRLGRLSGLVLRHRDRLDPVAPERAARLEDGEDLPDFARRVVGEICADRVLAPLVRSVLGCEMDDVSAAFFLLTLASLAEGAEPLSLEGGNSLEGGGLAPLVSALAAGTRIRTGCEVFSVETETGGARVRYMASGRERSAVADAVVLAVPAPIVPILCPKLTPQERGFFDHVRYLPAVEVHLMLERPPPPGPFATGFAPGLDMPLRRLVRTHALPGFVPAGRGLLQASLSDRALRAHAHASDDAIVDLTLDALARTPLGRLSPTQAVVHRFEHAHPSFGKGALSMMETFRSRIEHSPRIAFAGDYWIAPNVEGALTSGMQAASRIVRSLER